MLIDATDSGAPVAEDGLREHGAPVRRLLPLGLLLALGAAIVAVTGGPRPILEQVTNNRDWLHGWVGSLGVGAPLAFIVGYAMLMSVLWVPAWLCSIIGGFLFGFWFGALYSLVGATLGATGVFLLARYGLHALTRHAGPYVRRFEAGFRSDAFSYLVVLRLVPLVPFAVVNIVPASVGVPVRTFVLATLLGIVPSTLIYAGLGNGLGTLGGGESPLDGATVWSRPDLLLPLIGLALLALTPVWYRRVRNRRPES